MGATQIFHKFLKRKHHKDYKNSISGFGLTFYLLLLYSITYLVLRAEELWNISKLMRS